VIADANAPDEDHWLAMMTGQIDLPEGLTIDERRARQLGGIGKGDALLLRREQALSGEAGHRVHDRRVHHGVLWVKLLPDLTHSHLLAGRPPPHQLH